MSTIETGTGEGYLAKVNSEGRLQAEASVTGEVTSNPCSATSNRASFELDEDSTTLLDEEANRVELLVQNQGSEPAYVNLGADPATDEDWKVPGGGEFRLERYTGVVKGISTMTGTTVLVLEIVR